MSGPEVGGSEVGGPEVGGPGTGGGAAGDAEPVDPAVARELGYVAHRLHVLDALVAAVGRRHELVDVVAAAADLETAVTDLTAAWEVDEVQARAVLDLQVRRLTARERERLVSERERLVARRAELGG